jgi:hypothetical protein
MITTIIKAGSEKHAITVKGGASNDPTSLAFSNLDDVLHNDLIVSLHKCVVAVRICGKLHRATVALVFFIDNKSGRADEEHLAETKVYGIRLNVLLLYIG